MRVLLLIIFWFIGIGTAQADSLALTAERMAFLQAKFALTHGNYFNFQLLSNQLHQYVLYPYLKYAAITQQLNFSSAPEVDAFLKEYADTPLAERLRARWLSYLAYQQQWPIFLKYYQPSDNSDMQCLQAQALWNTNQRNSATDILSTIWLAKDAIPSACMPILKSWQAAGDLTPKLAWQRVDMSLKNNLPLDKDVLALMPSNLQGFAKLWQAVRKNPNLVNQANLFLPFNTYTKAILVDGISHYAVLKPQQVAALWPILQNQYNFSWQEQQIITKAIAIELARSIDPTAINWLTKIKPEYTDELVQAWRIRTALAQQNWSAVIANINQLSATARQQAVWRYWYARALSQTGHNAQATLIYTDLSHQVDYYGLLASNQLRQNYMPINSQIINNNDVLKVAANPSVQRAHELYNLHLIGDARREWQWALKHMTSTDMRSAAQLAMQWQWFDRALITAAKAGDFNNIPERFPLGYRQQVVSTAQQHNIDPAWVLGIMRQESGFMSDAKSSVGALGLMQLMPKTAKIINNNIADVGLLNANTNINLGCNYLKQLASWYNNNQTIATAAYNIGPTRLQKWIPLYNKLPADIWVDILPWQETRNYVQTVSLATAIYRQQLHEVE